MFLARRRRGPGAGELDRSRRATSPSRSGRGFEPERFRTSSVLFLSCTWTRRRRTSSSMMNTLFFRLSMLLRSSSMPKSAKSRTLSRAPPSMMQKLAGRAVESLRTSSTEMRVSSLDAELAEESSAAASARAARARRARRAGRPDPPRPLAGATPATHASRARRARQRDGTRRHRADAARGRHRVHVRVRGSREECRRDSYERERRRAPPPTLREAAVDSG